MLLLLLASVLAGSPRVWAQDSDHDGLPDAFERGVGRYEIVPGRFTWTEAKSDAERRGGHLATVINAAEWADLKALLGAQLYGKNLWLGGTDEGTEGEWRWITGEKWSFTNWRIHEPGNDSLGNGQGVPENYLMIWGNETESRDGHQLYWNDAAIAGGVLARDGYLLERASWTDPNDPDTDDDGLSDAQEQFPTGTYEEVYGAFSWSVAKAQAESKGGRLACIYFEADLEKVRVVLGGSIMWLGGVFDSSTGNWGWVSGRPFLLSRWGPFRPFAHSDRAYLFAAGNDGSWYDSDVSESDSRLHPYILERGVPPETDPNNPDTDGDQLKDGDEIKFFKTDPTRQDTDGDGLSDDEELRKWKTNPLKADSDGDGLSDAEEVTRHHTSPNHPDTDGDGFTDKQEVDMKSDPLQSSSIPGVRAEIRKAVEVEFQAEAGAAYAIQRAMPDGSWTRVGLPILGEGRSVRRLFSWDQLPGGVWRVVLEALPKIEGMVYLQPGTFVMGSPVSESQRLADEVQHTVTLTKGFWMGQREVTQQEFFSLMGRNPSYFTNGYKPFFEIPGDTRGPVTNASRLPVEQVTWADATNYCAHLTQRDRLEGRFTTGYAYRLPTEAEWEYACRAGTTSAFNFGTAIRQGMANFYTFSEYDSVEGSQLKGDYRSINRTTEGGAYVPNAFGLHDMHGNVAEWCSDWYGDYPAGQVIDPVGPKSGELHVFRGGSFADYGVTCRAAQRGGSAFPTLYVGFRVVLAPVR